MQEVKLLSKQQIRQEAIEWAQYNIRVNAVAPTWVKTDLTVEFLKDSKLKKEVLSSIPLGRMATVDDVAAAICFLASEQANMITGTILPIDGGLTAQ